MKRNNGKSGVGELFVSVSSSVLLSVVAIVVFAAILCFVDVSDKAVDIITLSIKIVSVLFGVVIGVRSGKNGAIKGVLTGIIYAALCYLSAALTLGDFTPGRGTLIDTAVVTFAALIGGVIVVNLDGRKR